MSEHAFCPTCQAANCMRVGGVRPRTFDLNMVGTIAYTCRFCGTAGWGPGTSPWLICSYEPGPIGVELDGNAWCATRRETFVNLQESLAGSGATRLEAVKALLAAERHAASVPQVEAEDRP